MKKNAKTTKTKIPSRTASKARARTTTTLEKIEGALASTAAFITSAVSADPGDQEHPRATDLLVHHHRKIEELFDALESPKVALDATLRALADHLAAHIAIEEQLFYPAVRTLDPDLVLEGLEEHAMGRFALKRLLGTRATDAALKARIGALKELMENHHKEEERELFPKARTVMSKDALHKLGTAMKELFDANVKRGHEAVLATFDDDLRRPVRAKSAGAAKAKRKTRP